MNKTVVKGIVIFVGIIVTLIGQNFLGDTLAYSIIAAIAITFGPVIAGVIGLFSQLLYEVLFIFRLQIFQDIRMSRIFSAVIFGLILGKIFQKTKIGMDVKRKIKFFGLFFISTTGLSYVCIVLSDLIFDSIKLQSLPPFQTVLYRLGHHIFGSVAYGVIGLVIVLIYHKVFKGNIPFFPIEKIISVETQSSIPTETITEPSFNGDKMKFCSHCGAEINPAAVVCVKCGCPVANLNPTVVNSFINPNDAPSTGYTVLGFFFPLIGLILFLLWTNTSPQKAKSCRKGALICFIVNVIGVIIGAFVTLVVIPQFIN